MAIGGLLLAQPLAAHAELEAAVPAPGAQVVETPAEVRLTFSQPLQPDSAIFLFDSGFQPVRDVRAAVDPQKRNELAAPLPPLEPGTFTVQWLAVAEDGHPLGGSYAFALVERTTAGGRWWVWGLAAFGVVAVALVTTFIWKRCRS